MARLDRNAVARQVARAEAYFKSNQGRHRPLTLSALRLFKLLVFLARKGKHTPTLGWLAETSGLSRSTVQRALRALGKQSRVAPPTTATPSSDNSKRRRPPSIELGKKR